MMLDEQPRQVVSKASDSLQGGYGKDWREYKIQPVSHGFTDNLHSVYNEDMPGLVIEHMSKGCSIVATATKLGISIETWDRWYKKNQYPEFTKAVDIGIQLTRSWWEEIMHRGIFTDRVNTRLLEMNMRRRFPLTWGEKQEDKEAKGVEVRVIYGDRQSPSPNANVPLPGERYPSMIDSTKSSPIKEDVISSCEDEGQIVISP